MFPSFLLARQGLPLRGFKFDLPLISSFIKFVNRKMKIFYILKHHKRIFSKGFWGTLGW